MKTELLRPIDGLRLAEKYRVLLRPGESETDANGTVHRLPRFFYEIGSWEEAHEIRLAPHFTLAELVLVDGREARLLLNQFPHYVCWPDSWRTSVVRSTRRYLSAQMVDTARPRIRSAAQQAFMRGLQLRIFIGSATLFFPTQGP